MRSSAVGLLQRLAALWLVVGRWSASAECEGRACQSGDEACQNGDEEGALLQVSRREPRGLGAGAARLQESHPHYTFQETTHESLGCFPRAFSDLPSAKYVYEDKTCVNASQFSALDPCRSGMPFFRLQLHKGQSYLDCFTFCLSKGLDLSGLIEMQGDVIECRCGATPENRQAWHMETPPAALLLPLDREIGNDDPNCELVVFRYTGHLEDSGVPFALTEMSSTDVEYLDQVATSSENVTEEEM